MTQQITHENSTITYQVIGNGPDVMLLHGFGEDGTVWTNQVEHLKTRYRVIIPDIPGTGKSESIPEMSMEELAESVHSIIKKEKITSLSMLGHSMGGYILLAFAEKYGAMLNRFGLIHSSAFADSEEKKATRKKGIEFIREHGAMEFLKTATPNLFSKKSSPDLVKKFFQRLPNFSGDSLVAYYNAMMQRPDRTKVLTEATVPVLFVFGTEDTAIPLSDGLKQCHLPRISYIHTLKNSGHMGMIEESEKLNHILDEFLQ